MANNYTLTSTLWKCGKECSEKVFRLADLWNIYCYSDPMPEMTEEETAILNEFMEIVDDPDFGVNSVNKEEDGIWFTNDESADIDAMASLVKFAHDKGWTEEPCVIEYCWTCDKPRIDEFGGGACVIFKGQVHWMNSGRWSRQKLNQLTGEDQKQRTELVDKLLANEIRPAVELIESLCNAMSIDELAKFVQENTDAGI